MGKRRYILSFIMITITLIYLFLSFVFDMPSKNSNFQASPPREVYGGLIILIVLCIIIYIAERRFKYNLD